VIYGKAIESFAAVKKKRDQEKPELAKAG